LLLFLFMGPEESVNDSRLGLVSCSGTAVCSMISGIPTAAARLASTLVLPKRIDAWSLTSLQQRLVKTGGRLIKHARYYWLLLAESHLTRCLFGNMLRKIAALPSPAG